MEKTAVTLSQARKRLEELVSRAQAGEDIFISRRWRVAAVMIALAKAACRQDRRRGLMRGQFAVPEEMGLAEGQGGAEI